MKDYTPTYNLKAVIRETGLTPATLRAWERRYGFLKPQRSQGGHRLYSEHDISLLKWLVARQDEGLSIRHAVDLWRRLEQTTPEPIRPNPIQHVAPATGVTLEKLRSNWIQACMLFDEHAAEQVLAQAFAIAAPEMVCTELLQKGLAEFGERWYSGVASVQQEHFASALAMRRLNTLLITAPHPTRPGRILAACPPAEIHEFSLLLLSYILRLHGWEVIYLGANVPLSRLDGTLQQTSPHLVLSVAQTLQSATALNEMANYLFVHNVPLAYGGGIFNAIPSLTNRIAGHFLGHDLSAVPQAIELLLSQPARRLAPQPLSQTYADTLSKFTEKEALVISSVTTAMQTTAIDPRHLVEANTNFTRYISAALALGDLHFLNHSIGWLKELLENHGLETTGAADYFSAYRQAVQQHLDSHAGPIVEWLTKLEKTSLP